MNVKEFKTKKEVDNAIDELNQKNGIPKVGNVTQTMCDPIIINGLYYLKDNSINKSIDLTKATDEKIDFSIDLSGKIKATKKPK